MKKKIIISACLLGVNCKYNGLNNLKKELIKKLEEKYELIPVCPEELGGLTTPRKPAEIKNNKVVDISGIDVTKNFNIGAEIVLDIALKKDIKLAVLKEYSPSCGSSYVYNGNFSGKKIRGEGITTILLRKNNIKVENENILENNAI